MIYYICTCLSIDKICPLQIDFVHLTVFVKNLLDLTVTKREHIL